MKNALRQHWQEYMMEAAELGLFMISAGLFATMLEHPMSPVYQSIADPFFRRVLMGIAMGTTAMFIVYSPWGKQSGAHFNPSVTLTFFRLGKIKKWDAFFYILAQFIGGVAGMYIARLFIGERIGDSPVHYAITVPGADGIGIAFLSEVIISFLIMTIILAVSNHQRYASYTGICAGIMVALYIAIESPISGMSMNPARTLGSAIPAQTFTALWIYFIAPPMGMLLAGEIRKTSGQSLICAKLHHHNTKRCIFCSSSTPLSA